jgi:hypothetical protein
MRPGKTFDFEGLRSRQGQAEALFIDRPMRSEAQRIVTNVAKTDELLVFSNRDVLRDHGFLCSKHLSQPEPTNLKNVSIDWIKQGIRLRPSTIV